MVTTISLFSQNFEKNQYSTEINCEYPFTYDAYRRITEAEVGIDLLRYKTIIRNGIIEEIGTPEELLKKSKNLTLMIYN